MIFNVSLKDLCHYAICCATRDWNKDPHPKKKTCEQSVDEINARAQWQSGKSVDECRREVRRWDRHLRQETPRRCSYRVTVWLYTVIPLEGTRPKIAAEWMA